MPTNEGRRRVLTVIPENETRKQRRARLKAERELLAASMQGGADRDEAASELRRLSWSAWWGRLTPRNGWGPTEVSLPPHRATTRVIGVAYPFLSGSGLGSDGVLMGHLLDGGGAFCVDPWVWYQRDIVTGTSMLLIGEVGSGKSTTAKAFATRMIGTGRQVFVASDPKNEWVPVAHALGGQVIEIGPGLPNRLNPLDPPPRDPSLSEPQYRQEVSARRRTLLIGVLAGVLGRKLAAAEHTAVDVALDAATNRVQDRVLTIVDVYDELQDPTSAEGIASAGDAIDLVHGLRRLVKGDLAGLFDGPSTVTIDMASPIVVVATGAFERAGEEARDLASLLAAEWLEAALTIKSARQRIVVYDEGYRMLRNSEQLQRMSDHWKLARHFGLTNLLIMHRISDLDAIGDAGSARRELALGLLADTQIRIIGAQGHDQIELTRATLGTTDTVSAEIERLGRGEFVWMVRDQAFLVHTDVTVEERDRVFNTDARMKPAEKTSALPPRLPPLVQDPRPEPAAWDVTASSPPPLRRRDRRRDSLKGHHR